LFVGSWGTLVKGIKNLGASESLKNKVNLKWTFSLCVKKG
jgi:hypothetical protein